MNNDPWHHRDVIPLSWPLKIFASWPWGVLVGGMDVAMSESLWGGSCNTVILLDAWGRRRPYIAAGV